MSSKTKHKISKEKDKEPYSFEKKKKLATKISEMKNKTNLRKIKKIIFDKNPGITARKNDRGYLMFFHNYENETYYKIEKFLNKIEKEKLEKHAKSITENSDHLILSSDAPSATDYSKERTRLRYSNREKRLIKRRIYEKIISEKINTSDVNRSDVIGSDVIGSDVNRSDVNRSDVSGSESKTSQTKNKIKRKNIKKIKPSNDNDDTATIFSKSGA